MSVVKEKGNIVDFRVKIRNHVHVDRTKQRSALSVLGGNRVSIVKEAGHCVNPKWLSHFLLDMRKSPRPKPLRVIAKDNRH